MSKIDWEEEIKELVGIKLGANGPLFELVCYPFLKEKFGELEDIPVLDFKVSDKEIYIEIKYNSTLSWRQIYFIMSLLEIDSNKEFYIVSTREKLPRLARLTEIVDTFETILGKAYLHKLDNEAFYKEFKALWEQHKRIERYLEEQADKLLGELNI